MTLFSQIHTSMTIIYYSFFKNFFFRQELNYKAIEVEVTNGANKTFFCRTYEMLVEDEGKPSPHYKDVILRGARQHSLPEEYIRFLESVEDNGFQGEVPLYNLVMEEVNKCLTLIS